MRKNADDRVARISQSKNLSRLSDKWRIKSSRGEDVLVHDPSNGAANLLRSISQ